MITDMNALTLRGRRCLLLYSGGFDSTFVALTLKRAQCYVIGLSINYENRPSREIQVASEIRNSIGMNELISITAELTDDRYKGDRWISSRHEGWIAYRNLIFFGLAAHYALRRNCEIVAAGVRVWDTTAYDDATRDYLLALEKLLAFSGGGIDATPKMHLYLPIIESHEPIQSFLQEDPAAIKTLSRTWSCWRNELEPCGHCAPCKTRSNFMATLNVASDQKPVGA
jgi:7-cyano-7-deazaguanine synthase